MCDSPHAVDVPGAHSRTGHSLRGHVGPAAWAPHGRDRSAPSSAECRAGNKTAWPRHAEPRSRARCRPRWAAPGRPRGNARPGADCWASARSMRAKALSSSLQRGHCAAPLDPNRSATTSTVRSSSVDPVPRSPRTTRARLRQFCRARWHRRRPWSATTRCFANLQAASNRRSEKKGRIGVAGSRRAGPRSPMAKMARGVRAPRGMAPNALSVGEWAAAGLAGGGFLACRLMGRRPCAPAHGGIDIRSILIHRTNRPSTTENASRQDDPAPRLTGATDNAQLYPLTMHIAMLPRPIPG